MGTMDALRTWRERNPDATSDDWRVAQGQGWKSDDTFYQDAADRGTINQGDADRYTRNQVTLPTPPARVATATLANDKQKGLAWILIKKLEAHNPPIGRVAREWFAERENTITFADISPVIDRLRARLAEPVTTTPAEAPQPVVQTRSVWAEWRSLAEPLATLGGRHGARFAVDTEDGARNSIAFWWIVPSEGPQGTRYFIRQVIGGQEPRRVRMAPEAMIAIAKKINDAGPYEAMLRYGRELGECGHCGRHLTNDESRALGIGPVCRTKGR